MDLELVRDVTRDYKKLLGAMVGGGKQFDFDGSSPDPTDVLGHLATMPDQMETMLDHQQTEKAMRWLGFMQGVLWARGVYTLNELRKHNAPDCEDK